MTKDRIGKEKRDRDHQDIEAANQGSSYITIEGSYSGNSRESTPEKFDEASALKAVEDLKTALGVGE